MSIRITTQRLNIREYIDSDFQGVHIYAKDPETVRSLLKLGFEELRMHRIITRCDPENVGSERVLQKSSLRKDAH